MTACGSSLRGRDSTLGLPSGRPAAAFLLGPSDTHQTQFSWLNSPPYCGSREMFPIVVALRHRDHLPPAQGVSPKPRNSDVRVTRRSGSTRTDGPTYLLHCAQRGDKPSHLPPRPATWAAAPLYRRIMQRSSELRRALHYRRCSAPASCFALSSLPPLILPAPEIPPLGAAASWDCCMAHTYLR